MYVIAINSKVFSRKSAFLVLAVSYLYIANFEFLHLISFDGIGTFSKSLNHSYQYFFAARFFEASVAFMIFGFLRSFDKVKYYKIHLVGALIFIVSVLVIQLDVAPIYYVEGYGQTASKLISGYITVVLFIGASIFIYRNKDLKKDQRMVLVFVFLLKALSQMLNVQFTTIGDFYSVSSMMLRFISYGGLYIVFIQQTVTDPYTNVYQFFQDRQKELVKISETDSLTGLYNHSLTFSKIEEAITKIGREYSSLCVILFDVDNFKQINDSFGHLKGDEMLLQVTRIFSELELDDKIIGRYGGDEFVLAVPDLKERGISPVFDVIQSEFNIVGQETGIYLTFSSGVVCWKMGDNATDLIRKADIKMYQSKEKGKNQFAIWKSEWI